MTNSAEHIARLQSFAEAYTAAWCSQDAVRVASFYAEDGSLSVNGATPAVGRKAITAVAQGFMFAFPDIKSLWMSCAWKMTAPFITGR